MHAEPNPADERSAKSDPQALSPTLRRLHELLAVADDAEPEPVDPLRAERASRPPSETRLLLDELLKRMGLSEDDPAVQRRRDSFELIPGGAA